MRVHEILFTVLNVMERNKTKHTSTSTGLINELFDRLQGVQIICVFSVRKKTMMDIRLVIIFDQLSQPLKKFSITKNDYGWGKSLQ